KPGIRPAEFLQQLSVRIEMNDALVSRIRDVNMPLLVYKHAFRTAERFFRQLDVPDKFILVIEMDDPVVAGVGNVNMIAAVDEYILRISERRRDENIRFISVRHRQL